MKNFKKNTIKILDMFIKKHSKQSQLRKVAVFDADGTLWRGDIGEAFFKYQVQNSLIPKAPLIKPWEIYCKAVADGKTADAFGWLAQWNEGVQEKDLRQWIQKFMKSSYGNHKIFSPMRELIKKLLKHGFEVWIVSGSMQWVVEEMAACFGMMSKHIIGTAVEVQNGVLTKKLSHFVPYRQAKVKLIKNKIQSIPLLVAGNTYWDKDMMLLTKELAMAVHSEKKGGPNYYSEQKLFQLAKKKNWITVSF